MVEAAQEKTRKIPYRPDEQAFSVQDYWSTPREFMAEGGDCEDIAIARYMLLRSAGIENGRVKMVVVIDQPARQFHALAACLAGDEILFMEGNKSSSVQRKLPAAYKPLYMVDEREWTIFVS